MESIHVLGLREIAEGAKTLVNEALDRIINAIDTKILVGNIHVPAEKKPRKKRVRKQKAQDFPPPKPPTQDKDLPDADENSTFYRKKKVKKETTGE